MPQNPTIAVVIAAYNAHAHLDDTLRAIAAQDVPFECVVVDDGSTDDTYDVALRRSERDERFRVLRQTNEGPIVARNAGAAATTADFVLFCDADDLLGQGQLAALVAALHQNPDSVGALCGFTIINERSDAVDQGSYPTWVAHPGTARRGRLVEVHEWNFASATTRLCFPPPAGVAIRRSVFAQLAGFDPAVRRSEDYELWVRAAQFGPFEFVPDVTFSYRSHPHQRSRTSGRAHGAVHARATIMRKCGNRSRIVTAWHGSVTFYWSLAVNRIRAARHETSWSLVRASLTNMGIIGYLTVAATGALVTPQRIRQRRLLPPATSTSTST